MTPGEVMIIVAAIGSPILSSATVMFFMRRSFKAQDDKLTRVERRMDCFEQSQHACQLANAKDYATWDVINRIDEKVDGHEGRISALEAKS